jgi:hypothetical protein
MPYQVGYEFFENRVSVITKQLNQYDNLMKYLDGAKEKIAGLNNSSPSHAHLDFAGIADKYEKSIRPLRKEIENLREKHPDHLGDDKVLAELERIFTDSIIGKPFGDKDLEDLIKDGEERYSKKIPPGYRDQAKKEDENGPDRNRKYGDLIIWKQIINKAEVANRPIIFVTNDAKDDWVLYAKDGRKLGAKPELKKEMLLDAKVDFALYSSDEFLDDAHKRFSLPVKRESVTEVKKYRQLESERMNELSKGYAYRHADSARSVYRHSSPHNLFHDQLHKAMHIVRGLSEELESTPGRAYEERIIAELNSLYKRIHHVTISLAERDTFRAEELVYRVDHLLDEFEHMQPSDYITLERMKELHYINKQLLDLLR